MRRGLIQVWMLLAVLLPAVVQAQLRFATNNGAITITGYTGNPTNVNIPSATNGYPVVSIGLNAFNVCTSLTNITIPNSITYIGANSFYNCANLSSINIPSSVTNIGNGAFSFCRHMTVITVDPLNPFYSSIDGVLFDKSQANLLTCPGGKAGSYTIPGSITNIIGGAFYGCSSLTNIVIPNSISSIASSTFNFCSSLPSISIPNSVTSIGSSAFFNCTNLVSITIPSSVTSIASQAFGQCYNLSTVYFLGNAPYTGGTLNIFINVNFGTVYYLPGTVGWASTFQFWPTVLWNPQAQTGDGSFGVRNNQFGFNITGSSNSVIVVEVCTNISNPTWTPAGTNTLNTFVGTNGTSYFSDPQWTNNPAAFYRLRSP